MSPHAKKKTAARGKRRWVAEVSTESTYPRKGLFAKSAPTIARELASKKVSPKGAASGMRMLTFFINRAGEGLSASRRRELEKAKALLSKRVQRERAARERRRPPRRRRGRKPRLFPRSARP